MSFDLREGVSKAVESQGEINLVAETMDSLPCENDLECVISGLCYDMEDMEAKMNTFTSSTAKKIMKVKVNALKIEHSRLMKEYTKKKFIKNKAPTYRAYDDEMSRGNEAIDACYDF